MKQHLNHWLTKIQETHAAPASSIIAYNFGLFESENGFMLYLVGTSQFSESDDDWACDAEYLPEHYLSLPEFYSKLEWQDVLQRVVADLREWKLTETFQQSFLAQAQFLSVGFDDSDLVAIE